MKGKRSGFNVFKEIESVKRLAAPLGLNKDSEKLRGLLLRCRKYRVGQVKKLDEVEAQLYEILLKNKLHPKTVYEWMLLEDVPPHIKDKLQKNKISKEAARQEYVQWKKHNGTRLANELMAEIKNVIGRLKWKSQEESNRPW